MDDDETEVEPGEKVMEKEDEPAKILTKKLEGEEDKKADDFTQQDEEDKVAQTEANFWDYFFQLLDILDGTSLQGEYNARAGTSRDRLVGDGSEMNWNFWIMGRKTSSFASYTIALKKAIDRIRKVGGFSREETTKLKMLIDQIVRQRRKRHRELGVAGAPGKTLDGHEHAINLWIRVKKSLDNQPLDCWKLANFLCDATMWAVGVGVIAWILFSVYHFFL